jgi:hypothetical protein
MPPENHRLLITRRDDLLAIEIELVNLRVADDGLRLVREDAAAPALLVIHFAPQHLAEEAFFQFAQSAQTPTPPAQAILAGPSRLAFVLPADLDSLPLTLDVLLDWAPLTPSLAPNALPPDTNDGPPPAPLTDTQSAIEFPYRLLLSPDANGRWQHRVEPFVGNGRAELWHTRLEQADGDVAWVRAVAFRAQPDRFRSSLSSRDLEEIVRLSSDFSIRPKNWAELGMSPQMWRVRIQQAGLFGYRYMPQPIRADELMLTPLGASARLRSEWRYPPPVRDEDLTIFGMPLLSLEQYQHIAGLGRDQYVRVVRRGCLSSGHRASIIKITERQFAPRQIDTKQTPNGPVAIFGATAYLRQYFQIMVQEPEQDYAALSGAYEHGGREMPLRRLRLTTLVTPKIDFPKTQAEQDNNLDPLQTIEAAATAAATAIVAQRLPPGTPPEQIQAAILQEMQEEMQRRIEQRFMEPFWIRVNNTDFEFNAIGREWEGRAVTLAMPLVFVPAEAFGKPDDVRATYAQGPASRRQRSLNNQTLAIADPNGSTPESTRLSAESLTFDLQVVPPERRAALPVTYRLRTLLHVAGAAVHIRPIEEMTGRNDAQSITFDQAYLDHGLDAQTNQAGVFAALAAPVKLAFAVEKAGGLARPDASISRVSSRQGALSDTFAKPAVGKLDLIALFGNARLLGGITLGDILGDLGALSPADFAQADMPDAAIQQLLDTPGERMRVPVLRSRPLSLDGKPAVETRFVWKPVITSNKLLEFGGQSDLVLDARTITPLDGSPAQSQVAGELRSFSMNFAGVVKVTFARLAFRTLPGHKPDITADGVDLEFLGPLQFVNTLKNILPADGFSDPPALAVTPSGITAGYTLGMPSVGVGIFSIQNIALSAALSVPFTEQPAGVRFAISERHHPFIVTVGLFGGGGFFGLSVSAKGVEQIEAAIEFGGNVSLNLGVASGGVYVMAGIYFSKAGEVATLTGYLRCGGYLSVLGLISVSLEFYLGFTYRDKGGGRSEVWGQASLTVCVKVVCFSKSVTLTVERRFGGAGGDPTFADTVEPDDWEQYCLAFA